MGGHMTRIPRYLVVILSISLGALFLPHGHPMGASALAQSTDDPPSPLAPLRVGTFATPASNFAVIDEDGVRSGFFVDLAREIAAEIGAEIVFEDFKTAGDLIMAQVNGETDIIAGVARITPLERGQVFSDPVATGQNRLVIRIEDAQRLASAPYEGLRIGVVPPVADAKEKAILALNTQVDFTEASAAIMALMIGDVDALLMPEAVVYFLTRTAGIDHRITFVDEPLRVFDRVVAIRDGRSDLLPLINAAIGRMEADGRLAALRTTYFIDLPPPPPDVLSVGVYHFPPYQIVQPDGQFTGLSVEALRDLAERSGLTLEFEEITLAQWQAGPGPGRYDMLPQAGINDERRTRMDFTYPVERASFSIFTRAGDAEGIAGLDDLAGRKTGVQPANLARRIAERHGGLDLVYADDKLDLLTALLEGRVDAILYPTDTVRELAAELNVADQIATVEPPFFMSERAPALRFGLGQVRERLNSVTPGYLISAEHDQLRTAYFSEPVFWTQTRIRTLIGGSAGLILMSIVSAVYIRYQQRGQQLETERLHSAELAELVSNLEVQKGELQRSNRELDEFAYIASHDLKEPLRGIGINANFLLREELPGKAKERAVRMTELAEKMERLISDLLFFSRLGRGDEARVEVRPAEVVDTIRHELLEWLEERNGEIAVLGHLPVLKAERVKVKTVLQNLIVNAIKYNDAEHKRAEVGFTPEVTIEGQTLKNAYFVRDNGIGIDERNRDKVFRIFSRLNRDAEYGPGTGSGLAFVRKIVEAHGGVVTFSSSAERGTTFYLTLPLASQDL